MCMCSRWFCGLLLLVALSLPVTSARAQSNTWLLEGWAGPALGRALTNKESDLLPRHVFADGTGLPEGEGRATDGERLFTRLCADCHGSVGQGGRAVELVGDRTLLNTEFPDRGIAVYWPHAPTLYEYIYRSMPPDKPASLSPDELYALLAHLLTLNGLLEAGAVLNAATLSAIVMPNRQGFRTIGR